MQASRNKCHQFVKISSAGLIVFTLACVGLSRFGYRFNSTPSLPEGFWKVGELVGPVQRGQIVSICPSDTPVFQTALSRHYLSWGLCRGGYASLLKPVAAVAGDQIVVSDDGIRVNGVLLPNSKASTRDGMGRPLRPVKVGTYAIKPGTVWVVSSYARSFDSRYFGPLPSANILGTANPLWVGGAIQ
jgi:conjugative transfer signal peptidase TraF